MALLIRAPSTGDPPNRKETSEAPFGGSRLSLQNRGPSSTLRSYRSLVYVGSWLLWEETPDFQALRGPTSNSYPQAQLGVGPRYSCTQENFLPFHSEPARSCRKNFRIWKSMSSGGQPSHFACERVDRVSRRTCFLCGFVGFQCNKPSRTVPSSKPTRGPNSFRIRFEHLRKIWGPTFK